MGKPLLWGLASRLAYFVGLGSFLGLASGPGEWACEPHFSNPIKNYCLGNHFILILEISVVTIINSIFNSLYIYIY